MTARAGEWRARVLLAASSLLITLVLAEVAARVLARPPAPIPIEGTPISELSLTLGWKAKAGGAQRIRREDFEVSIAINSLGLRGPEIPYDAEPGRKRLAIMGDSFAQGYYAEEPDTLRGRLAASLQGCQVDVLNAGQPGYSTDQEWLFFKEEIRRYHPKEVVLLFYYNDLVFNTLPMGTANRAKPLLVPVGDAGGLQLAPSVERPVRERRQREPGEERSARVAVRRPAPTFHGSALWAFAASRLQRSRPDLARSLAEKGLAPTFSNQPPAEYLPFGPKDAGERAQVDEMWKRTALILSAFRDDVRSSGAALSVFYVPARFEVNDDAWTFVQQRYEPGRPWNRDGVRLRAEKLMSALDIPMIDATPQFQAAEKTKARAYLEVDGHWNSRGNEIAFDGVYPLMRRAFACGS